LARKHSLPRRKLPLARCQPFLPLSQVAFPPFGLTLEGPFRFFQVLFAHLQFGFDGGGLVLHDLEAPLLEVQLLSQGGVSGQLLFELPLSLLLRLETRLDVRKTGVFLLHGPFLGSQGLLSEPPLLDGIFCLLYLPADRLQLLAGTHMRCTRLFKGR
jgi:hypothetical protein